MISLLYRMADAGRNRRRGPGDTGRRGEDLAHRFLRRHGLTVVARNYRPLGGGGELDIMAWERDTLVFVEVKTRASADFGSPDRAVGLEKEKYLRRAAGDYLRRSGMTWDRARFDLVNIILKQPPEIEWIKDAFAAS